MTLPGLLETALRPANIKRFKLSVYGLAWKIFSERATRGRMKYKDSRPEHT